MRCSVLPADCGSDGDCRTDSHRRYWQRWSTILSAYRRYLLEPLSYRATAECRAADLFDALAADLVIAERQSGVPGVARFAPDTFCDAVAHYRACLSADPANERARAQLEAYGTDFTAWCVPRER